MSAPATRGVSRVQCPPPEASLQGMKHREALQGGRRAPDGKGAVFLLQVGRQVSGGVHTFVQYAGDDHAVARRSLSRPRRW